MSSSSTYQKNPTKLNGAPDLCQLVYLAEPNIVENLNQRYQQKKIYTSCTCKVLIAVNPYTRVEGLDSENTMRAYQEAPVNLEGLLDVGGLGPHVFTQGHGAYHNMVAKGLNQSVTVCGESGSGKTESAKLIMSFLAYTSTKTSSDPKDYMEAKKVGKQVLDANPILESFGNAKTKLNNNSSRFGKFTKMLFQQRNDSGKDRQLIGACIETYLLEKSRVVKQDKGERNYHVFYYVMSQAQHHPEWRLTGDANQYHYLNQSGCTTFDGDASTDSTDFEKLIDAMAELGWSMEDQQAAFGVVAGILHLGNVTFSGSGESCEVSDLAEVENAAALLGVDAEELHKRLVTRSINVMGRRIIKPLNQMSAEANRDSMAKGLYNGLFRWICNRINETSSAPQDESVTWIGILDVFGFEIFENNSFEQFCINFANERLQNYFNYHVLKAEQDLYRREALIWTPIDLPDNQDVINLIMAKRNGIFALLDTTCIQPKGTDLVFTQNLFNEHKNHVRLQRTLRAPATRAQDGSRRRGSRFEAMNGFTVQHYAGDVVYDANKFLVKNADSSHPDTTTLFATSNDRVTASLLLLAADGRKMKVEKSMKFCSTSTVFSNQLTSLMQTLKSTQPYFVRCIKPNTKKKAFTFNADYVIPQLRCGGLIQALHILKHGFPTRCSYDKMVSQFGPICQRMKQAPTNLNKRDFTEAMINIVGGSHAPLTRSDYQLGLSMVFFKPGKQAFFQRILELSADQVTSSQVVEIKKWLVHKRIVRMRGTIKGYLRLNHFLIFAKIQKAARVMSIINKTMFRSLRRARGRLGNKRQLAEDARRANDAKYQAGLRAQAELAAMRTAEAKFKAQLADEKGKAERLAQEKREMEKSMRELLSNNREQANAQGAYEDQLAALERGMRDAQEQARAYEEQLREVSEQLQRVNRQLETTQMSLSGKDEAGKAAMEQLMEVKRQAETDLKALRAKLQAAQETMSSEREEQRRAIDQLQSRVREEKLSSDDKQNAYEEQLHSLGQQLSLIQDQIRQTKLQAEDQVRAMQQRLDQELSGKGQELSTLQRSLADQEEQNANLQRKVLTLEQQSTEDLRKAKRQHDESREEMDASLGSLQQQLARAKGQQEDLAAQVRETQEQERALQAKYDRDVEQLRHAQQLESERGEQQTGSFQQQLALLQQQLQAAQDAARRSEDSMQRDLSHKDDDVAQARKEASALKTQLSAMKRQLADQAAQGIALAEQERLRSHYEQELALHVDREEQLQLALDAAKEEVRARQHVADAKDKMLAEAERLRRDGEESAADALGRVTRKMSKFSEADEVEREEEVAKLHKELSVLRRIAKAAKSAQTKFDVERAALQGALAKAQRANGQDTDAQRMAGLGRHFAEEKEAMKRSMQRKIAQANRHAEQLREDMEKQEEEHAAQLEAQAARIALQMGGGKASSPAEPDFEASYLKLEVESLKQQEAEWLDREAQLEANARQLARQLTAARREAVSKQAQVELMRQEQDMARGRMETNFKITQMQAEVALEDKVQRLSQQLKKALAEVALLRRQRNFQTFAGNPTTSKPTTTIEATLATVAKPTVEVAVELPPVPAAFDDDYESDGDLYSRGVSPLPLEEVVEDEVEVEDEYGDKENMRSNNFEVDMNYDALDKHELVDERPAKLDQYESNGTDTMDGIGLDAQEDAYAYTH